MASAVCVYAKYVVFWSINLFLKPKRRLFPHIISIVTYNSFQFCFLQAHAHVHIARQKWPLQWKIPIIPIIINWKRIRMVRSTIIVENEKRKSNHDHRNSGCTSIICSVTWMNEFRNIIAVDRHVQLASASHRMPHSLNFWREQPSQSRISSCWHRHRHQRSIYDDIHRTIAIPKAKTQQCVHQEPMQMRRLQQQTQPMKRLMIHWRNRRHQCPNERSLAS